MYWYMVALPRPPGEPGRGEGAAAGAALEDLQRAGHPRDCPGEGGHGRGREGLGAGSVMGKVW